MPFQVFCKLLVICTWKLHLFPDFLNHCWFLSLQVLPRQTCGLFTHTIFLKDYPKGHKRLVNSIHGGELFQVIVDNPVSDIVFHTVLLLLNWYTKVDIEWILDQEFPTSSSCWKLTLLSSLTIYNFIHIQGCI